MTEGPDTYTRLCDFLMDHMRMSHVYQPVMLRVLLEGNGKASLRAIAGAFLGHDQARWASPSRNCQHGSAVPSAEVSCTRSSRGDWKTCLASRWGVEGD